MVIDPLLHQEEGHQDFEHTLTVRHVVDVTVILDDALGVGMQAWVVFEKFGTLDITRHLVLVLPVLPYLLLLGPELFDV